MTIFVFACQQARLPLVDEGKAFIVNWVVGEGGVAVGKLSNSF